MRKKFVLVCVSFVVITIVLPAFAYATKPCAGDSWFAKKNRSSDEWKTLADWVVTGKLTVRNERLEPYPNCNRQDQSQCEKQDNSTVTLEIENTEKGKTVQEKRVGFKAGFCAPDPPKEVGTRYRFYGKKDFPNNYLFFEKLP